MKVPTSDMSDKRSSAHDATTTYIIISRDGTGMSQSQVVYRAVKSRSTESTNSKWRGSTLPC